MNYQFQNIKLSNPVGSFINMPSMALLDTEHRYSKLQCDIGRIVILKDITDIIKALQQLMDVAKKETYEFGYEIYLIVCDADNCKCYDIFKYDEDNIPDPQLIVPASKMLQLMIDWKEYIIQWRIDYLGEDPNLYL
jgi:hypothetical protein